MNWHDTLVAAVWVVTLLAVVWYWSRPPKPPRSGGLDGLV